ncbi:uncharacterized protein [Typha angustifolia]|uniref:uncharacterized protein isoform X2 n=1 Tax=Typha angustifolia TaxID=59011 RepID=UPI003C2D1B85
MVSKKQKKAALQEKLQLLRSVTNSSAKNKTSIILDASKYIQQLKQKISACVQELAEDSSRPTVSVATLEKGLLINVSSTKSFPGMLVSILENQFGSVDALMVTDVVLQAMKKCTRSTDHKEQS